MPTEAQMQATAAHMMEKYQLPRFDFRVNSMMVRFDTAPCDFPATIGLQDFNYRKNFWDINCKVVCNDEFLILDLDCGPAGTMMPESGMVRR